MVIKGDIEGVIHIMEEPLNASFVDPNPAKKPIEEAPKMTRCPVPEDSAAVNVVVVVDQCCLACLPAGMYGDASVCL